MNEILNMSFTLMMRLLKAAETERCKRYKKNPDRIPVFDETITGKTIGWVTIDKANIDGRDLFRINGDGDGDRDDGALLFAHTTTFREFILMLYPCWEVKDEFVNFGRGYYHYTVNGLPGTFGEIDIRLYSKTEGLYKEIDLLCSGLVKRRRVRRKVALENEK